MTGMIEKLNSLLQKKKISCIELTRAYLIMVALDEKENPTEVPALLCDTDEEKAEFEAGKLRAGLRKERRKKNY